MKLVWRFSPFYRSGYEFALIHVEGEEEVLSVDPFEARFTVRLGGDELVLRVDDDLSVVEAGNRRPSTE